MIWLMIFDIEMKHFLYKQFTLVTIFSQVLNVWLLFSFFFSFLLKLSSVVWYGKIQNEHKVVSSSNVNELSAWHGLH